MSTWIEPQYFPSPSSADSEGIISIGGDLSVDWLMDAYCHGIFPWPVMVEDMDDELLVWWSPDPRAIVDWNAYRIPRRLQRKMRNSNWTVTSDRHFADVMRGCSRGNHRTDNTWINAEIIEAYQALHAAGYAHSIEVMAGSELIGGIYGVAIGGMFAAESMFYRKPDASKIALAVLLRHLKSQGFSLFDIQQMTPHMQASGAVDIDREEFLTKLRHAISQSVRFGCLDVSLPEAPESIKEIG
jgi:leucyl/phenylalanyl-tRNA--protein transferase